MIRSVAIIVLLATVSTIVMSKDCNEHDLKECLYNMQHLITSHFQDIENADKSSYCQSVEEGGKCMTEAYESCKDTHPKISNMISVFYTYLNHVCTDKGKAYMDIVPCLKDHKSEFEACKFGGQSNSDDPLKDICKEVDALYCVAELSKKVCDNGKTFGTALETRIQKLESDVCYEANSAVSYRRSCWIVALIFLILFSVKSKFCKKFILQI